METKCHKPTMTGYGMNPPTNMVGLDSEPSHQSQSIFNINIHCV